MQKLKNLIWLRPKQIDREIHKLIGTRLKKKQEHRISNKQDWN